MKRIILALYRATYDAKSTMIMLYEQILLIGCFFRFIFVYQANPKSDVESLQQEPAGLFTEQRSYKAYGNELATFLFLFSLRAVRLTSSCDYF